MDHVEELDAEALFASVTVPAALHVRVAQGALTVVGGSADGLSVLALPRPSYLAVWLPAEHRLGHGLPDPLSVHGEPGAVSAGIGMVMGVAHNSSGWAHAAGTLSGAQLRLVAATMDRLAGFAQDAPAAVLVVERVRYGVTNRPDGHLVTLLSSQSPEPDIRAATRQVAPRRGREG